MTLVNLYAPTNSGTVVGADGVVYKIVSGIVTVPSYCSPALVTAGYSLAPTDQVDTAVDVIGALNYTPASISSANTFTGIQTFAPSAGGTAVKLGAQQAMTLQTQGVPFTLHASSAVFSGTRDDICYWGYNLTAGDTAARVDLTEVQLKFALESNYNNAGSHFSELNFDYVSTDGLTNKRPLSWNANRSTQASAWSIAGGSISFLNESNVQEWWLATTAGDSNKIVQKGGSSQAGNMMEWRDSNGAFLSGIRGSDGFAVLPGIASSGGVGGTLLLDDCILRLKFNAGGSNSKVWQNDLTATQQLYRTYNDAVSSAFTWMAVTRSGQTVTTVDMSPNLSFNVSSNLIVGGSSALGVGGQSMQIQGNTPTVVMQNTAAAANNQIWTAFETNTTQLFGRILNDALTVGANWITVTRSGTTVTGVAFPNGPLAISNTVNSVSPTSPNRTVTMVIGGTTYYIPCKTTND